MTIQHEFWRVVASGLFQSLLDDLVAVTSRDARHRLIENGAFTGKLHRMCYDSLAYVVNGQTINLCWDYVADPVYNPHLRDDVPPMVENATVSGGDTLTADTPPTGYTIYVYEWDYTTFTEVGPLSENSSPGSGIYVLALVDDENPINVGLPSSFLNLP